MTVRSWFTVLTAGAVLLCPASARAAAAPNTVVITQGVDADTLDPIKTSVTPSANIQGHIFEPLAWRTASGSLAPGLALSWKRVSPLVWEFHLRHNVTFSNGDPFTSADVKFTIEKILDPAYKSQQISRVDTIAHVDAPAPDVVRITTKRPVPLAPAITRIVFIADGKYWQAHGDAYMAEHPIGTGPYVLAAWRKDDEIDLDANPHYWGAAPPIAHVIFRPIPDAASRVAALKTGESDLITNVPFQYALGLTGGQTTRMTSARSVRVLYIAFNTEKPGPQNNKLLRQALNYAIDVPAIIKAVLGGRGYELGEPVPPNFFGYDPTLKPYTHDDAKARALLAKAGYPDGKGLELTLNTPQGRYNADKEVALAVAGQLQKYGIAVTVRSAEWVTYLRQAGQKQLVNMYELGWGNNTYDAGDTITSLLTTEGGVSTYSNPELDKLNDEARYELDPQKRAAIYRQAMELIHEEAPWLFLFEFEDLYATTKRLQWNARPDEAIYAWEMHLK